MYPLPARITIDSAEICRRFGTEIAYRTQAHDTIALCGPIGAGKTTLAQGIIAGLGITAAVQSPTFTIIHTYPGPLPVHHIDLYRVQAGDLDELGIEELISKEHVTVLEWAERAAAYLPADTIWIEIAIADEQRREMRIRTGAD